MGVQKLPKNANEIESQQARLLHQLEKMQSTLTQYRLDVRSAAERLTDIKSQEILQQLSVDELNRVQKGIRIKTLMDSGYHTVGDLCSASDVQLEQINGISKSGAQEIKSAAEFLAQQARNSVRIRLNLDENGSSETSLVLALAKWIVLSPYAQDAAELMQKYASPVQSALLALAPAKNFFSRFLASKEKKLAANNAYQFLTGEATSAYRQQATALIPHLKESQFITGPSAWKSFEKDPILFNQALSQICPEHMPDETVCGLPQELSEAVYQEELQMDGLRCQLRPYQILGVKYILHQKRVLLGDEMGLGKTVQAIASMVSLRNQGNTHFLVVCPASVIENWCREIRKHSDLNVVRIHGIGKELSAQYWIARGGVGVTTYETTGIFHFPRNFSIAMVVTDEAHYVKNPKAQRTIHVQEICACAERILFMTGTAMENRVDEMISLISILQPEIARKIAPMSSLSTAPQFQEAVAPVYYRRKREDVLTELPDLIEKEEWCELLPEEERLYESSILNHRFNEARRVSWNIADLSQSSKARRMKEIVETAQSQGRKIIVFSFFLDTIDQVISLFPNQCTEPINGSVSPARRQQIVDDFQNAAPGTILPAQIQAGGTGLNIQSASVIILCEPQFKPSIENQAISRAYRMGQSRSVLVHRLLCQDSVDERITELLQTKQEAFDAFADDSAAAEAGMELDDAAAGRIMKQEEQRIQQKITQTASSEKAVSDTQ